MLALLEPFLSGTAVLLVAIVLFYVVRMYLYQKSTTLIAQEAHATDKYMEGLRCLDSDTRGVRMGGFYALEQLASVSEQQRQPVLNAVVSRIRCFPYVEGATVQEEQQHITRKQREELHELLAILRRLTKLSPSQHVINLSYLDLHQVDLRGADLRGADLRGADLSGSDLSGAKFSNANLSDVNLTGATARETDFEHTDLTAVDFTRADLSDANLARAYIPLIEMAQAKLVNTNLTRANLTGVNLADTDLSAADLSGADLTDANVSGAEFFRTDVRGTCFMDVDLTEASVTSVITDDQTRWPEGYTYTDTPGVVEE